MTSRRRPGLKEEGLEANGLNDEGSDGGPSEDTPQDERTYFAESRQGKARGQAIGTAPGGSAAPRANIFTDIATGCANASAMAATGRLPIMNCSSCCCSG
jgi:hypothetical protein